MGQATVAARNQHVWRGWVEQSRMPALVAGHDVCLGIFGTTPKGLRVVPNKAYQARAPCSSRPPGCRMASVIGHEDDEVVVVGALEQRGKLLVERAVETPDPVGDR
jgi:hypothetical protein